VGLEVLKEAFSAAVEFVLRAQQRHQQLEGQAGQQQSQLAFLRRVDAAVLVPFTQLAVVADSMTDTESSSAAPTPVRLQATALYYQFKMRQLEATEHQRVLRGRVVQPWTLTHAAVAESLEAAVTLWEQLASDYSYYGSSYVMADPFKEGYELRRDLGGFLCQTPGEDIEARTLRGDQHLVRSLELREATLMGYGELNVATVSVVVGEALALVETYCIALACLAQRMVYAEPLQLPPLCARATAYVRNVTVHLEVLRAGGEADADAARLERAGRNLAAAGAQARTLCMDPAGSDAAGAVGGDGVSSDGAEAGGVRWRRKKRKRSH
jgi:hypothetical protein